MDNESKKEFYYDVLVHFYEPRQGLITLTAPNADEARARILKHLEFCKDVTITEVTDVKDIPDHPINNQNKITKFTTEEEDEQFELDYNNKIIN